MLNTQWWKQAALIAFLQHCPAGTSTHVHQVKSVELQREAQSQRKGGGQGCRLHLLEMATLVFPGNNSIYKEGA